MALGALGATGSVRRMVRTPLATDATCVGLMRPPTAVRQTPKSNQVYIRAIFGDVIIACLFFTCGKDPITFDWTSWSPWVPPCNTTSQTRSRSCVVPPINFDPSTAVCFNCGNQSQVVSQLQEIPQAPCCQGNICSPTLF